MRAFYGSPSEVGPFGSSRTLFAVVRALPFMVLLTVLAIELSPLRFLYTGPLLSPAPALAAVTMGPVGTCSVIFTAGVVSSITATYNHAWGTQQVYANLLALLVVSVASLATSTVRVRRERELAKALRIAQVSQDVVLRPVPARLDGVRAAGVYLAAESGARIGGDLYDVVSTPFGVRVVMGDVRGKGLPAVRSAAAVLGAFREAAHYEAELSEVVLRCEAALMRELSGEQDPSPALDAPDPAEEFVTAVFAQVPESPVVEVVNRGHPPPLLLHRGAVEALDSGCPEPPLGLGEFLGTSGMLVEKYAFIPGDRLLLYTDGLLEARDAARNFFDLPAHLAPLADDSPQDILDRLLASLVRHTQGRLADDAAMVAIERARPEPVPDPA